MWSGLIRHIDWLLSIRSLCPEMTLTNGLSGPILKHILNLWRLFCEPLVSNHCKFVKYLPEASRIYVCGIKNCSTTEPALKTVPQNVAKDLLARCSQLVKCSVFPVMWESTWSTVISSWQWSYMITLVTHGSTVL